MTALLYQSGSSPSGTACVSGFAMKFPYSVSGLRAGCLWGGCPICETGRQTPNHGLPSAVFPCKFASTMNPFCRILSRVVVPAFVVFASFIASAELLPPGFRPLPLGVHALVGGRVVVKPGEVMEAGTIVIRNGLIQAVGTNTP